MSWASNWQHDLTPVDRDTSSNNVFKSDEDSLSTPGEELLTNLTLNLCLQVYENLTKTLVSSHPDGFCEATFDGLSCWPPTPLNQTAVHRCFSELNHVKYDDTQNVTKYCFSNRSWSRVNYLDICKEIVPEESNIYYYYFGGYTLSLVTLSLAITIFTHFKELRCLRNKIHLNFMWAHLSNHIMWILTYILLFNFQLLYGSGDTPFLCLFDVILLQYSYVTTFFWMLVEGLYLYIMVVKTLTYENFHLRIYVCIGWGLPMIVTIIWAIARGIIHSMTESTTCQWFFKDNIDLIFQIPVAVVVFLNFAFLIRIMCVLVTKLRSASRIETQQYYKAAKALLVLNPLLGTTYVVTFYAPTLESSGAYIFECVRAILLSTQGFVVALFYCFRNTEVQNTVRHHFDNWKASRSLGHSRMRTKGHSKDLTRNTEWTLVHTDEIDMDGRNLSLHGQVTCNGSH